MKDKAQDLILSHSYIGVELSYRSELHSKEFFMSIGELIIDGRAEVMTDIQSSFQHGKAS